MHQSEQLYQSFLEEMQSLENFRMTYTSVHPDAQLERDDPEVRRLIEAMAFFTAHTRDAALRNLLRTHRRLFQQFFSFMLSPLPAAALLQAQPTGRFAEPATLPRDSEILVVADGRHNSVFRTLADLRVLPIRLEGVDMLLLPKEGYRVVLKFQAAYARNDDIGTLSILVSHLNNYNASLQVLSNLRKHLERAIVVFDERVTEISDGPMADITFGALPAGDDTPRPMHPIEEVRSLLHFPERELYVNAKLPPPPRNWRSFSICLDLAPTWPKNLRLNKDVFQLFVVPILNLRRSMAQPILCDGMQERYAVRYPDPKPKFALHSVLGVYQIVEKGMIPLRHGLIMGGSGSYELERSDDRGPTADVAHLKIQFPEAFAEPKKIAVDALWFQPWFSALAATSRLQVDLYDRSIAGLEWELLGEARQHQENPLRNDLDGLLQVLALKNRSTLNLEDLQLVLNALGSMKQSVFKQVPGWIADLEVSSAPRGREQGGIKHIYKLKLKDFDPSYRAMVGVVLNQVSRLLNAWTTDAEVVVEATLASTGERIAYD